MGRKKKQKKTKENRGKKIIAGPGSKIPSRIYRAAMSARRRRRRRRPLSGANAPPRSLTSLARAQTST